LVPLVLVKKPLQRCLLALSPADPAEPLAVVRAAAAVAPASESTLESSVETLKKRPLLPL
jgi:hypothetical protein